MLGQSSAACMSWADMADEGTDATMMPPPPARTATAAGAKRVVKMGELDLELDNSRDGINLAFRTGLHVASPAKPGTVVGAGAWGAGPPATAAAATTAATGSGAGAGAGAGSCGGSALQFGSVLAAPVLGRSQSAPELEGADASAAVKPSPRKRHAEEMMEKVVTSPPRVTSLALPAETPPPAQGDEKKRRLRGPEDASPGSGSGGGKADTEMVADADTADATVALPGPPALLRRSMSACEALTDARLEKRQRQIDIGKSTEGYKNYLTLVPIEKRTSYPVHPRTPQKSLQCSKRSWDGQVRKWRRALHKWDPKPDGSAPDAIAELKALRKARRARGSGKPRARTQRRGPRSRGGSVSSAGSGVGSAMAAKASPGAPLPRPKLAIAAPNLGSQQQFPVLSPSPAHIASSPFSPGSVWASPAAHRLGATTAASAAVATPATSARPRAAATPPSAGRPSPRPYFAAVAGGSKPRAAPAPAKAPAAAAVAAAAPAVPVTARGAQ